MLLQNPNSKPEYKEIIRKVLHYINENLAGDVSLETLAGIANYSPFHFRIMFSETVLETPKQYVIRLRLERAAHFIKLFPQLAMKEIAESCGFSSNSVFSRAFKNYYGISPEIYRDLPTQKLHFINKEKNTFSDWDDISWITPITDVQVKIDTVVMSSLPDVETMYACKIACVQTTLSHRENISLAFKSLFQWANPLGLITNSTKYFGIWLDFPFITPTNKCRFLCGIELGSDSKPSKGVSILTFNKGRYLKYKINGDINETLDSLIVLNHNYVESIGFEISEMICYELLEESPLEKPYEKITRQLIIPVKPK
jgi:AraC family transcriptional regulator